MSDRRVYTVEEVGALLPELARLVTRQLARHAEIEDAVRKLGELAGGRRVTLEVLPEDGTAMRGLKREIGERVTAWEEGWERVSELGGVVKDPHLGLVDFYGSIDGRLVWLCWKLGEDSIAFYHELTEGFAGRKPLGAAVLRRLLN